MESTHADAPESLGLDTPVVDAVLGPLVKVHEDPFACLRELVQNALDAGSREVDISVHFAPGEGEEDEGLLELRVTDRGDGLGRHQIETRLVRLFASVGDVEPDTIGRLGTGFVTVFALEPELVVVDSSWRGEHWRVLIEPDGRYTLRRRGQPVYGSVVRIFKKATAVTAEVMRHWARGAAARWCRHAPATIRFEGEVISEHLGIDAPCAVTIRDERGELVVGHARGGAGSFGFYRRGLTLVEGGDTFFPGVAFKVTSDLLDQTVRRDAIIEDAVYEDFLERVREAVEQRLSEQVFTMLESHVWSGGPADPDEHAEVDAYLYDAAVWHVRRGHELPVGVDDRGAFRSPAGLAISASTVGRALDRRGVVFHQPARSPLSDAVEDRGHLVIKLEEGSPAHRLLLALDGEDRIRAVSARFCMPVGLVTEEDEAFRPLTRALAQLIVDIGGEILGVEVGHFAYEGSSIADAVAITQEHFGDLSLVEEARGRGDELISRLQVLVLNGDLPVVVSLGKLARGEPEIAALQLLRLLYADEEHEPGLDANLVRITMERRWKRMNR